MPDIGTLLDGLIDKLAAVHDRIAFLEGRLERTHRYGTVTDVDAENHVIRVAIGVDDDDTPHVSPWVPYSRIAGTRKVHTVPSKGQQMLLITPDGEFEQAKAIPFTWSDSNPSPSNSPDEDIDLRGKTRRTQKDADLKQEVDGVTVHLTKQNHTAIVHKDETKQQNQAQTDPNQPWPGNKGDPLHQIVAEKASGVTLTVNTGDASKEHKLTVHPDDGIKHSVNKGDHYIEIKPGTGITASTKNAITRLAQQAITDTAQQILHNGPTNLNGATNIAGTLGVSQLLKALGGAQFGSGSFSISADGAIEATSGGSFSGGLAVDALSVSAGLSADTISVAGAFLQSAADGLTAAGTTRETALALTTHFNNVATGPSGAGVVLQPLGVGEHVVVVNSGANPTKIYAPDPFTIDGASGATGVSLTNAKRCAYFCLAAHTIISAQLGPPSA